MNTQDGQGAPSDGANAGDKMILIVDDEYSFCELIASYLAKDGFRTGTATSVEDALKSIEAATPDLIILDLAMPGQSGFELMRTLQGSGQGGIPIFIVTARALDNSTVQMLRQEGNVVEYFSKPLSTVSFMSALHRRLGTKAGSPRHVQRREGQGW